VDAGLLEGEEIAADMGAADGRLAGHDSSNAGHGHSRRNHCSRDISK
jgi:hypothetical protein